ncbi:MAG: ABC transporter substrate-binding protein, partial [Candidatus Limnocylindria bacterium]
MTRLLAILTTLALVLGACAGAPGTGTTGTTATGSPAAATATYGGTITFGLENDVSNLDPMLSGLFVDRNIHYAMYDSLVRVDNKGNIIPWLAEKWTTTDEGKTVTFNLRQGVKFHDGSVFDAEAVKWNLERYINTKGSLRTGDLASVASVTVVDPATVKLSLKAAFSPLLGALVDRAGMMVSKKVVDTAGADFTLRPFKAGTGPFILTDAVKNDHYTLERNPDWWGKDAAGNKLPFLDKIIVKPILEPDVRLTNLRTGDVQVLNGLAGKDVPAVKA